MKALEKFTKSATYDNLAKNPRSSVIGLIMLIAGGGDMAFSPHLWEHLGTIFSEFRGMWVFGALGLYLLLSKDAK